MCRIKINKGEIDKGRGRENLSCSLSCCGMGQHPVDSCWNHAIFINASQNSMPFVVGFVQLLSLLAFSFWAPIRYSKEPGFAACGRRKCVSRAMAYSPGRGLYSIGSLSVVCCWLADQLLSLLTTKRVYPFVI